MKNYQLDFERIDTYPQFYDAYCQILQSPDYFGRNLDALYDSLHNDIELPCTFKFLNLDATKAQKFKGLLAVFKDLNEELAPFGFQCHAPF